MGRSLKEDLDYDISIIEIANKIFQQLGAFRIFLLKKWMFASNCVGMKNMIKLVQNILFQKFTYILLMVC